MGRGFDSSSNTHSFLRTPRYGSAERRCASRPWARLAAVLVDHDTGSRTRRRCLRGSLDWASRRGLRYRPRRGHLCLANVRRADLEKRLEPNANAKRPRGADLVGSCRRTRWLLACARAPSELAVDRVQHFNRGICVYRADVSSSGKNPFERPGRYSSNASARQRILIMLVVQRLFCSDRMPRHPSAASIV